MKNTLFLVAALYLCACRVCAFVAQTPVSSRQHFSLHMAVDGDEKSIDVRKVLGTSAVLATYLMSNIISVEASLAMDNKALDFSGSSNIVAARSGGRAGGRSSMRSTPRSTPPPRSYSSYGSSTTVIQPMVAPSPVIVSPFGMGYGYNPFGGFGMGYGLGALNSAGNEIRDYRQESEIQRGKAELDAAKEREAQLEKRVQELEKIATKANP